MYAWYRVCCDPFPLKLEDRDPIPLKTATLFHGEKKAGSYSEFGPRLLNETLFSLPVVLQSAF